MNDKEKEFLTQEIKMLRRNVFKAVDTAIGNILRCCVNLSPEMIEQVVAGVFNTAVKEKVATSVAPVVKQTASAADDAASQAARPATKRSPGRKAIWSQSSEKSLRQAYCKRRRANREIEQELEAELIKRFPTYDAATHTFTGRSKRDDATDKVQMHRVRIPRPYKDLSNNDIMIKYHAAQMADTPIEDALHVELKRRYPTRYDAVNRVLRDGKRAGKQKRPLRELSDNTIKTMYYTSRTKGISNELHAELIRRFPGYDAKTRTFIRLGRGERFMTQAEIKEYEAQQRRDAVAKATDTTLAPKKSPVSDGLLNVSVLRTKMSPDGVFYDVYVNGTRILHNHIGTEIHTFMNGTVLGVYGTATDIPNLPTKPSWQIYDTKLSRRTFAQTNSITKKNVYITRVAPIGDKQLSLEVSNKMHVILDYKPSDIVFKIASENEKQK